MVARRESGTGEAAGSEGDILWLAGQDIRRDWLAYLTSAGYMLVLGAVGAPRGDTRLGTWSPEILFLIMMMILAQPFLSREYVSWDNDRVAERLIFLRMLPIPLDAVVRGRMIAMLAALVLNVPAFFMAFRLAGNWEPTWREYMWFVIHWVGIAIGASGYSICMEMGASVKRYSLTNLAVLAVAIGAFTVAGTLFDVWLVRGSVGLVERFGPLMAAAGLVAGITVFLLAGRLAIRRLRNRELVP